MTNNFNSLALCLFDLIHVNNNSPIQDYVHPDDQTQPTFEMTPGFKPFTYLICIILSSILRTSSSDVQLSIHC